MSKFYSPSTNGFYDRAIHGEAMPTDAVEISDEQHAALLDANAHGLVIRAGADGRPVAVEPEPPSAEQARAWARATINAQRDAELVAGVVVDGKRYHSDDRFLMELLGMVMGYQAGVTPLNEKQAIRTMDNEVVQLGPADITALAAAVGGHRKAVYAASWAAKDAL